jgi:hypothetical protein
MNMRFIALLAIIFLAGVAFAGPKLKKVQLTKEISIQLPSDFQPMPDEGIAREYPATTKPLAVYTSPNGLVDFSVTQKPSHFRPQDLEIMKEFYKASLLEKFTKVDFIRNEIKPIKDKNFIVFEYVSTLADQRKTSNLAPVQKYSIIEYTVIGNQALIFTLHVPYAMKKEWQPVAEEIMNSIKIK